MWVAKVKADGRFEGQVSHGGPENDRAWAVELACERGVAGVPGSAFLSEGMPRPGGEPPDRRGRFLRLSFGKREALLKQAIERLGPCGPLP